MSGRTSGLQHWRAVYLALMVGLTIVACDGGAAPTSTGREATSPAPSSPSAGATSAANLTPAPSGTPSRGPSPTPLLQPTPRPGPTFPPATNAALEDVYAGLRPANLRSSIGMRTFSRGSAITLDYEIENRAATPVLVPVTTFAERPAAWIGITQTWVERLGADTSLDRCLPNAGRKGAWYALGGYPAAIDARPISIPPGRGMTSHLFIGPDQTSCFPAGRYRYHLEYRRIEDPATGEAIAAMAIDLVLREPDGWQIRQLPFGGGHAILTMPTNTTAGKSTVELSGMQPGSRAAVEVRVGCDRDAPILLPARTFTVSTNGTARDVRTFSLSHAARAALGRGQRPVAWLFSGTMGICLEYTGAPIAVPAGRGPTTWGGALLRQALGDGVTIAASSETLAGAPIQAVDGDGNLTWNAGGFAPAWIEIDLGRDRSVSGVRLLPSQLPAEADTAHRILGRKDGGSTETLLATLTGVTRDNAWLERRFETAATIRYLRIETVSSPSWVAWRDVELIGVDLPKVSRHPVGYHDGVKDLTAYGGQCFAYGWASDPDASADVTVRILIDGVEAWSGAAALPRDDVANARAGDRTSGFHVDLRSLLTLGVPHEIRVQAKDLETGAWIELGETPRTLTCR